MKDPTTDSEWREAADAAAAFLALERARRAGLVVGGPAVDVARATDLLKRAVFRGFRPRKAAVDELIRVLLRTGA